jgi:predicted lysophospholipase L1 biosynthesis ABC-type transport system permease subunit
VSENIDGWKSRILNETGTYISFIDVWAILKQVRSYAQMVLQGVLWLLLYITIIGLLAFMTAERAFFQLKIRKIQLYRLLGCSEKNGFQLLFFESILGNIIPMIIGSVVWGVIILYLLRNNPILKITYIIIAVALLVLMVFFLISFFYTRHSIQGHIKKTDPRIWGIDE